MKWPWQYWLKPADPQEIEEAREAVAEAEVRKSDTQAALVRRRRVVVHNHLAYDIRQALERRS